MVAAREPPERASILCDLQACISEHARIICHWTRDIVRRLLFSGEREEDDAAKVAENAEKGESPAAAFADEDDRNKQPAADNGVDWDWYGEIDYYAVCKTEEDSSSSSSSSSDTGSDSDDGIDRRCSPPSTRICYDGDNENIRKAYCFSRYLVEVLAARPRYEPFVGTFAFIGHNMHSMYYSDSSWKRGRNLDSRGDLILHAQGRAIEDRFHIQVNIPEEHDEGGLADFVVDPYACNRAITRTISTRRGRKIDVTFMPMHKAIQADVRVTLVDLMSAGTSAVIYAYGEITAHHQLYGDDERAVLFSHRDYDKAEVADDGEVPLSRKWVAVPIYLEPLLLIKLNLRIIQTNNDNAGEGRTIAFRGNITFFRDEYEKVICTDGHGKVKVKISYPWY